MNAVKKIIFDNPDEMETKISYQAMRITWFVINSIFLAVVVWSLVGGNKHSVPLLALLAAEVIYFTIKAFLKWRMTRGVKDNE